MKYFRLNIYRLASLQNFVVSCQGLCSPNHTQHQSFCVTDMRLSLGIVSLRRVKHSLMYWDYFVNSVSSF